MLCVWGVGRHVRSNDEYYPPQYLMNTYPAATDQGVWSLFAKRASSGQRVVIRTVLQTHPITFQPAASAQWMVVRLGCSLDMEGGEVIHGKIRVPNPLRANEVIISHRLTVFCNSAARVCCHLELECTKKKSAERF